MPRSLRRAALLVAVRLLAPGAVLAGVQGTPHDMALWIGDPFSGPCVYCHVPHMARGERLWTTVAVGPPTGWGSRTVASLCYTCHDSSGGGYGAVDVTTTAYSPLSHGYTVANSPPHPDGPGFVLPALPYVDLGLLDCTTCHDPHANTPPFLRAGGIDELCRGCHGRDNPGRLGGENLFGTEETTYSLHPTGVEYVDAPGNGPTALEDFPDLLQVPTASGQWRLGAHRVGWQSGSGAVGCQTCHPVHGGETYNGGVLPGPPASSLTPVENTGTASSPLCQLCHRGGDPEETVGEGSDHPINSNDGDPETTFPAGWPAGPDGEPLCSSCHAAHGGVGGTSLLRTGGNTTDGWCFSCHDLLALTPAYHHSCREIDDPAIFTSVLTCGDCHGTGDGWSAHNGFDGFKVGYAADDSQLCEACHVPENPALLDEAAYAALAGRPISFAGAVFPAEHGRISGTDSHLVDEVDDDSIENCRRKETAWEDSGGFSKYGPAGELLCESCHGVLANAGLLLGTEPEAHLTGGWKTNLLLEAYEDNSPGTGIEVPDFVPGPTDAALCRGCHFSEKPNVDPTFVHNPEAHTVLGYTYPPMLTPYGRTTTTVLTAPRDSGGPDCPEVSTADQLAAPSGLGEAPGAYSYPEENVVDCDSCHRPHGADDDGADDGKHRLLEYTDPGLQGTTPCLECHDTMTQCGYRPHNE